MTNLPFYNGIEEYGIRRRSIMWKPQILTAMLCITLIAVLTVVLQPTYLEFIAGGAVTGIGMLGMKLLEKE